jgi:hypothetical protein
MLSVPDRIIRTTRNGDDSRQHCTTEAPGSNRPAARILPSVGTGVHGVAAVPPDVPALPVEALHGVGSGTRVVEVLVEILTMVLAGI